MQERISLWLEIEPRCNLACRFCYNFWRGGDAEEPGVLSTPDLLRGLETLFATFTCDQVAISGGEPLLRRDLGEIVRFVKKRGIPVVLTTNGTLLTSDRIDDLSDWGVDTVQVSLHSPREQEHDWLSHGHSFRAALRGLMLLRRRGIGVAAVFVATGRNVTQFPDLLRLLALIDIRSVILNRFIVSGLGVRHQAELGVVDDESLLQVLHAADPIAVQNGQAIVMGTPVATDDAMRKHLSSVHFGSCPVSRQQRRWTIGVDGAIRYCNHSPKSIGNVLGDGVSHLSALLTAPERRPASSACNDCKLNTDDFANLEERFAL